MDSKSYSKGISWFSDCRIPFVDEKVPRLNVAYEHKTNNNFGGGNDGRYGTSTMSQETTQGRFPANILVSDDMLNDGSVSSIKQNKDYIPPNEANSIHNYSRGKYSGIQDKGSNSRYYNIDKWFDNLIDV